MQEQKREEEIPLTEDLMREHGVLNRVLLIYEEVIKRLERGEFPLAALVQAITIVKSFIEDYHEKLEEDYIFPLFEQRKKSVRLTRTLRTQHQRGREITGKLKEICDSVKPGDAKTRQIMVRLLRKFIIMYRPHEAREDTILFPQVRSLISEKEFQELGEKFEALEHTLFGKGGFHTIVQKVEAIEKELGIYKLEQFTPQAP